MQRAPAADPGRGIRRELTCLCGEHHGRLELDTACLGQGAALYEDRLQPSRHASVSISETPGPGTVVVRRLVHG